MSAAAEAASFGAKVMIVDSDLRLGGQLIKQTHKFFGSSFERAGTRGFVISDVLLEELKSYGNRVQAYTNCTALGYYKDDGVVSCMEGEENYFKVLPKKILVATGAQERLIPFPNNDLPGVYGAGAVQTLMNVYGVVPGKRILMVGAGNIGLIVSYQLLQAGVEVAAIVEAMPKIGGYWVHAAKVRRLGVPILLEHSIKEALGKDVVEGAIIQQISPGCGFIGEEIHVDCDVICMAVGLNPTCELLWQAGCEMKYIPQLCGHVAIRDRSMRTTNPNVWVAGDAAGIEEASSAMVEGRIAGLSMAHELGYVEDKEYREKSALYWERLNALRNGEASAKIREGIAQVLMESSGGMER
ncbi:sarcosine oxidase subunit alpha [Acetomicrobium thermoterrenum DSM 13490]|uniref:Sarcosine oxidase subunit alpha n=1 Tax=Acetomicrobium thermoterrenum DSM 13490 TaxID=1120987 RepID=A0A1H3G239_9BACT|nr:sarcosine oxidase subunit alpha [Acetomicrobium thermoterrenum DSM 13490]